MRSYHVDVNNQIKEQVKACFAFYAMDWGYCKEATILGKDDSLSDDVIFSGQDISFEEFWKCYSERKSGIMCMAAFEPEDYKRIGMMLFAEEVIKDTKFPGECALTVNDYTDADDAEIKKFFDCLYAKMKAVK